MFRTFEQVESEDENAPARSTGNLGLGLAVVARIISQLGGQLRVESKVGYGSKFTFVLHFRLPGPEDATRRGSVHSSSTRSRRSIDRTSQSSLDRIPQEIVTSLPGSSSGRSKHSAVISIHSKHSEIDSLVEAISSQPASRSDDAGRGPARRPTKSGEINVEDSGTPVRSLKMDTSEVETPQVEGPPGVKPNIPNMPRRHTSANVRSGIHPGVSVPARPRRQPSAHNAAPPMSPPIGSQAMSPTNSSPSDRPMRIMIVEDDAINRAILLKKLTRDFAHEVKQAVHGDEAIRLFERDRDFDIILMDLQYVLCIG